MAPASHCPFPPRFMGPIALFFDVLPPPLFERSPISTSLPAKPFSWLYSVVSAGAPYPFFVAHSRSESKPICQCAESPRRIQNRVFDACVEVMRFHFLIAPIPRSNPKWLEPCPFEVLAIGAILACIVSVFRILRLPSDPTKKSFDAKRISHFTLPHQSSTFIASGLIGGFDPTSGDPTQPHTPTTPRAGPARVVYPRNSIDATATTPRPHIGQRSPTDGSPLVIGSRLPWPVACASGAHNPALLLPRATCIVLASGRGRRTHPVLQREPLKLRLQFRMTWRCAEPFLRTWLARCAPPPF